MILKPLHKRHYREMSLRKSEWWVCELR